MDTLAVVSFQGITGLAEDRYVNNWAIPDVVDHSPASNLQIASAIYNFYTEVTGDQVEKLETYLSPVIARDPASSMSVRLYDITGHLDGSPHGSPYYVGPDAMLANTPVAEALPSECAAVLTLEAIGRATAAVEVADGADPGTARDRPKQRRTGRVYLGPLSINAQDYTGDRPMLSPQFRADVLIAVKELNDQLFLGPASGLGVWSRADAQVLALESASMDDAFDTVRSRGESPNSRVRVTI